MSLHHPSTSPAATLYPTRDTSWCYDSADSNGFLLLATYPWSDCFSSSYISFSVSNFTDIVIQSINLFIPLSKQEIYNPLSGLTTHVAVMCLKRRTFRHWARSPSSNFPSISNASDGLRKSYEGAKVFASLSASNSTLLIYPKSAASSSPTIPLSARRLYWEDLPSAVFLEHLQGTRARHHTRRS